MSDLFPPGYDPAQLESDAGTAATKSSANNVLLNSGTHGLSALLTAINAAKTEATAAKNYADILDDGTHGLSALLTAINAAKTEATAAKNYADILDDGTYGLSALRGLIDEVESLLKNGTYGLAALETYVDDIPAMSNTINTINSNTSALADRPIRYGLTTLSGSSITVGVAGVSRATHYLVFSHSSSGVPGSRVRGYMSSDSVLTFDRPSTSSIGTNYISWYVVPKP